LLKAFAASRCVPAKSLSMVFEIMTMSEANIRFSLICRIKF